MLGNDVVDLRDPETRPGAQHGRFDARAFTSAERAALAAQRDPRARAGLRWALWAAKESAYKAGRRLDPGLVWSPGRFAVDLACGRVTAERRRFRVQVRADAERIHAVATAEARSAQGWIASLAGGDDSPSRAARALARTRIGAWLGVEPDEIDFARDGRAPVALRRGRPLPLWLSLSHHGRFVACALLPGEAVRG